MKRRLTALLIGGIMLCTMGIPALAAATDSTPAADTPQPLPASVLYYGQVTQVVRDDSGAVTRLALDSDRYGSYLMNISADTVWIDSGSRTADDPADLEAGEALYVFHSPVSTRSLPPQSAAYAVVRNIPQDAGCAQYHVVEGTAQGEDGRLAITTDNGGLILYLGEETKVTSYSAGGGALAAAPATFPVGTRIMAWYGIVLTSYPGQASPSHVMVLPGQSDQSQPAEGTQLPEGTQLTLSLDGKVPDMAGRYEEETAMVPVAAVAQALGFDVSYTPDTDRGALVTVESDTFAVRIYVDQRLLYGSTKIEGAVGMTGPQDYGKAAYIAAPGTTWAPARLFELLGKTVTLDGSNLVIQ